MKFVPQIYHVPSENHLPLLQAIIVPKFAEVARGMTVETETNLFECPKKMSVLEKLLAVIYTVPEKI